MKKPCSYCGRMKEEKFLINKGKAKICWLCDKNQTSGPRGKILKSKHGMRENLQFSA